MLYLILISNKSRKRGEFESFDSNKMIIKKYKLYLFFLPFLLLILLSLVFNNYGEKYFNDEMNINYSLSNILIEQKGINENIKKFVNNKEYTIDNPKVIINPYGISPLTALIIFNTKEETSIKVNINDECIFEMEKSKKHIIPIYGMYENKKNIINLNIDNYVKQIEIITDEAKDVNELKISKSNFNNYNDLYFMTSPVGTSASAYDQNGNLKWYLTGDFKMDFEWLQNGHFLVGIPEADVADRKIGFVEMDYLGKIYNYYVLENGYEFEFQVLKNGNYMLCGGNSAIFYDKAWIYEIDSNNGKIVSKIDIYEIFKNIDPNFDENRLNFKIIRNAFYYNEENNELIVSLRGLNSVVSFDYKNKKINYIFAPPGIYSEKFDEYLITLESGRYPLGIHSVFMTEEGYVGFFNNGYDRFNGFEVGGEDKVSHYINDYSSAEIYSIVDKKANLVWNFDANKKHFTHQYGSFNIYDENKLINFGWVLNDEYRIKEDATLSESEKTIDNTHAKIYEINKNNEIIFEASIDDGKYRIFKHNLYEETMDNFDYNDSNFYNTMKSSEVKKVLTRNIEKNLNNSQNFDKEITFTKYSIDTNFNFDTYDNVVILLVGKNNFSYKIDYKKENKNVVKNLNINLKKGEYALYLIINDIYFNTNTKVIY